MVRDCLVYFSLSVFRNFQVLFGPVKDNINVKALSQEIPEENFSQMYRVQSERELKVRLG